MFSLKSMRAYHQHTLWIITENNPVTLWVWVDLGIIYWELLIHRGDHDPWNKPVLCSRCSFKTLSFGERERERDLKRSACRPGCVGVHDASLWKHVAVRPNDKNEQALQHTEWLWQLNNTAWGQREVSELMTGTGTTCDSHMFSLGQLKFRCRCPD